MALDYCDGWYWEKEYVEHIQKTLAKATNESAPLYDEAMNQ